MTARSRDLPGAARLACGDYAVNTMQPFAQPFSTFGAQLPAQTAPTIGDHLTAKGVDWAWYAGGWSNAAGDVNAPGWTNGSGPTARTRTHPPTRRSRTARTPVPVPPPAVRLLRELRPRQRRSLAPPRRGGVHPGRAVLDEELPAEAGELRQADRRGERAPRLRERARRQRPPRRPAAGDRAQRLRERHDGRRDLRRVRRAVGPRDAAGPGRRAGAARPVGPGHAHPGARDRAVPRGDFVVDHTQYDTTSILATIEHRFGLAPFDAATRPCTTCRACSGRRARAAEAAETRRR